MTAQPGIIPRGVRADLPIEELRRRPLPARSADETARLWELLHIDERPDPCATKNCIFRQLALETCERAHCPYAWAGRSREDQARRDAQDAERKAAR